MVRETATYRFSIPDGWTVFTEGGRLVGQGPGGEELTVQSTAIDGRSSTGRDALVARVLQNAKGSLSRTLASPELEVVRELAQQETRAGLECWVAEARTKDGETAFLGAIFAEPHAVLLVTLEAPAATQPAAMMEAFVNSVGHAKQVPARCERKT